MSTSDYAYWGFIFGLVAIILSGFSVLAQYLQLFRKVKPPIDLLRGKGDGWLYIRVINHDPSATVINRCRVFLDQQQLVPKDDTTTKEKFIPRGGAENFKIALQFVRDDFSGYIAVKDGNKTIKKAKLMEIPEVRNF